MSAEAVVAPVRDLSQWPELLNASQLSAALGLGRTKFYALLKRGAFKGCESDLPGRRLYSKALVKLWLERRLPGDPESAKAEGRRFLAKARRSSFGRRPAPPAKSVAV